MTPTSSQQFIVISKREKHEQTYSFTRCCLVPCKPGSVPLSPVDICFQDESGFGQQDTTTRIWAKTGTRPRVVQQQQFENAYMFGAVCPATGNTETIIAPFASKEMVVQYLKQISEKPQ